MTPDERANKCAEKMWPGDQASVWLGLELCEITEARAVMRLTVEPRHTNGHGICHGGVIFSLADSTFAYACNSRNQSTVSQFNTITYIAPAKVGDQLTARANEVSLVGRNGIYDITVANQNGEQIAEFRGHSRAVSGQVFEE